MAAFDSVKFTGGRRLLNEISADKLNAILQEIRKNRPRGERGITVREAGDATYIGLAKNISGGGAATTPRQPWDLIAGQDPESTDEENPDYLVRVQPGTLAGFLPTNWDEEFECEGGDALYYAKAVVTTDGRAITGLTIAIDTQPPAPQEPQEFGIAETIDILFGLFLSTSVYRTIGSGNINANPTLWLTTDKPEPPQPGEIPYVQYYLLR